MAPLHALLALGGALLIVVGVSTSGESFYVIRHMHSGLCEVTTKRPQTPGRTVLGDLTFRSLALATARAQQMCGQSLK